MLVFIIPLLRCVCFEIFFPFWRSLQFPLSSHQGQPDVSEFDVTKERFGLGNRHPACFSGTRSNYLVLGYKIGHIASLDGFCYVIHRRFKASIRVHIDQKQAESCISIHKYLLILQISNNTITTNNNKKKNTFHSHFNTLY